MIYTITLNPSVDYRAIVTDFKQGQTNRASDTQLCAGGKGINVSCMLYQMGIGSKTWGFTAGFTGEYLVEELTKYGIDTDFIRLERGLTRINIKLYADDMQTEINAKGPEITSDRLDILYDKLSLLQEGDYLVLSGSVPAIYGNTKDIYEEIIKYASDKGAYVIVDTEKHNLKNTLPFSPFLVKPNHHELGDLFDTEINNQKEALYYAQKLQKLGARNVLVSMAELGAVFVTETGSHYAAQAPKGVVVNSVGAGDCTVAGFLAGLQESSDLKEAFAWSVACGSAKAFSDGFPKKSYVKQLRERVVVKECEPIHNTKPDKLCEKEEDFVTVTVDRPLGTSHPDYPSLVYPINYGYIEGVMAPDGEEQDAYIIGVDVPVDTFTGKKVAIIHRNDDIEEKWVIAPENTPFTKQQIEEMVYFQEQYFDSRVEILNEEYWDAVDKDEHFLGYQIPRSMAKSMPEGVYHVVVMVYTMTKDGSILVTQRSKNKTNPLKWEVTGGSILAGETPAHGAVRELSEETGIEKSIDDLQHLYTYRDDRRHSIYYCYMVLLDHKPKIILQEGETMNYQWLNYGEFSQLVLSDRFIASERGRFVMHRDMIEKKVMQL